jgi:integrase
VNQATLTRFPGVYRRPDSATYQFGLRAPKDLKSHILTPWAVRCSLGTADLRKANEKAKALQAHWSAEFARMRGGAVAAPAPAKAPDLTALRRHLLTQLEASLDGLDARCAGYTPEQRLERAGEWKWQRDAMRQGIEGGFIPDWFIDDLDKVSNSSGFARSAIVDAEAMSHYVAVADIFAEAYSDTGRTFPIRRHWLEAKRAVVASGSPSAAPTPGPALASASGPVRTINDALCSWTDKRDRPPKTVATFTRHAAQFTEMMGNLPLHSLDKQTARRFRDKLTTWAREQGKTANTANNVLVSVRSLINVARDEGWVEGDPFERLAVEVGGKESEGREPWTYEELLVLFDDPIWTNHDLPMARKAGGAAAYWIPLIACYTGARLSEIAHLWKDDLKVDQGAEVVEFRADEARGKRLKNQGSWRAVPMHKELVRLGLVDYAATLPDGPLFPDLPTKGKNGAGGMFGQWFGEFKTGKGFATPDKTMHSFRHLVATELRLKGVTEALANAVLGHVGQGIGQKVYSATIRRHAEGLREAVNRLEFPITGLKPWPDDRVSD